MKVSINQTRAIAQLRIRVNSGYEEQSTRPASQHKRTNYE